jgi:hypothetical protein
MGSLKIWQLIPGGSTLFVSVTPESPTIVTEADVRIDSDKKHAADEWPDEEIQPGPRKLKLVAPNDYTVHVHIAFASSVVDEATVEAHVEKPDGSTHGKPYSWPVKGKKGGLPFISTIIARTDKS